VDIFSLNQAFRENMGAMNRSLRTSEINFQRGVSFRPRRK